MTDKVAFGGPAYYEHLVMMGISNGSADVRFQTLRLATESQRAVEPITALDLKVVKCYISLDSSQSSDLRHKLSYQLKQFLTRLKRVVYSDWREIQVCKKKMKYGKEDDFATCQAKHCAAQLRIDQKLEFIQWLHKANVSFTNPSCLICSQALLFIVYRQI
jgi:hypothetical protein